MYRDLSNIKNFKMSDVIMTSIFMNKDEDNFDIKSIEFDAMVKDELLRKDINIHVKIPKCLINVRYDNRSSNDESFLFDFKLYSKLEINEII